MTLSVVIPALDEAEHIEAAVRGALDAPFAPRTRSERDENEPVGSAPSDGGGGMVPEPVEVIVSDGGSVDGTPELARASGAMCVTAPRGRASQLDAGVRVSEGDVVVFLHADTRLAAGWARAVRDALRDDGVVGGAFRLRFDLRTPVMRFIEWGAQLRVQFWKLPYGDQAIFLRRSVLDAIGGVPQQPILEDLDLVAALRSKGRLALLDLPVVTSARRYTDGGPLRTMLRHWRVAAGWSLGVDRARLLRWARR